MIDIIPAMDLMDGKCVRLIKGDFERVTVYSDDPPAVAASFARAGLHRAHVVDLDGARHGSPAHLATLRAISASAPLTLDFSGGLKTMADVRYALDAGAHLVTIGSIAVESPDLFCEMIGEFGADRFILAADVADGRIAVRGWQTVTDLRLADHVRDYAKRGISTVMVTDIGRDGSLTGPAVKLYRDLIHEFAEINLIASGGVASLDDIRGLDEAGCVGVIVGKALYDGRVTVEELAGYAR